MDNISEKDLTLRDLIKVIFRHKIVFLISIVTIMTSVYISLDLRVPVYRAGVRMMVTGTMQQDIDVARNLGPGSLVATQMSLVKSRPILVRTVRALNLHKRPLNYRRSNASRLKRILMDNSLKKENLMIEKMSPNERESYLFNQAVSTLSESISVYLEPETSIFNISVTDYKSRDAGVIANVVSRSFIIFDLEQQIAALQLVYGNKNETIVKLEKFIENMEEKLDGRILSDIEAIGPATVKIINQAGPGRKKPMRPSQGSGLMAAFVISMALAITFAFALDFFDMTFKSSVDVWKYLQIPYIGSVPKRRASDKLLYGNDNLVSKYAQLFQKLSNSIYIAMKEQDFNSILFSDAEEAEECAIIVANLGFCLAHKSGYKVLIIDADFREPTLHDKFNVPNDSGLANVIEGETTLVNSVQDLGFNLNFLPSGSTTSNPVVLVESPRMSDVINEAKKLYEIVLITCSDIKNHSDTVILSSHTDGVIFSIHEGKARRQIVQNAINPFKQRDIKIMGVILNNHKYVIPEIIYRLT